jgi:cytoplasmic iron level regulating protein YaaA (DUF328/UPF0246 family)
VHLILPPSETKRDGGIDGSRLDLSSLTFPVLTPERSIALAALRTLSRNLRASAGGLGLGPTQRFEIDRNRVVTTSPVMPALERYTGVLYEALDAPALSSESRAFAGGRVLIHSALFGLVSASDPIPAYRLSHNSRLPGISLPKLWREPIREVLASISGLVLDLRSDSYAKLGPVPDDAWRIHVVSEAIDGRRTALAHFNKKAKGHFARELILAGRDHETVEPLLVWARANAIRLEWGAPGVLDLVV